MPSLASFVLIEATSYTELELCKPIVCRQNYFWMALLQRTKKDLFSYLSHLSYNPAVLMLLYAHWEHRKCEYFFTLLNTKQTKAG